MPMKLLAVIPHYVNPAAGGPHGSLRDGAATRGAALSRTIVSLLNTLGDAAINDWSATAPRTVPADGATACAIDIVVLTTGGRTAFEHLAIDPALFAAIACETEPPLLGFEARRVFREREGQYDWYAFLEDDLEMLDPWFLRKLEVFIAQAGNGAVLQPQRFEESPHDPRGRLYVDGALPAAMLRTLPDRDAGEGRIMLDYCGHEVPCERAANPHSGCYFLRADQLALWHRSRWFDDREVSFAGPLESAATLGLARQFAIYKPAPSHAGFLAIRHGGTAQLNAARLGHPAPADTPLAHRLGLLAAEIERLTHRTRHLEAELANREAQLRGIFASRIWKAMEPVRRVAALVRGTGRRSARTKVPDGSQAGGGTGGDGA